MAVARVLAGRGTLPSLEDQQIWEAKRLAYKGTTTLFHEIAPDFKDYFEGLRSIAGPPAKESAGYELPPYEDNWPDLGLAVLGLKDQYVKSLEPSPGEQAFSAKL